MGRQAYEARLRAIDALRRADPPHAAAIDLGKALRDRNNLIVKKAAQVVAELGLSDLIPDLLAAYDRFFEDPVKTDPQCWAKTALVAALKDLGHDDAEPFYRGLAHVQLEPVWGGRADTAGGLRGTCVVALPACRTDTLELLAKLADMLADTDKGVRGEAASAIAHLGHEAGAAVLRLKARLGDDDPDVLGRCFSAILALEAFEPVAFVAGFLDSADDDARAEAIGALGAANQKDALAALRAAWTERPDARRAIALALAASPFEEATEIWREAILREPIPVAEAAVEAFAMSRFRDKLAGEILAAVERRESANLARAWRNAGMAD